MISSLTQWPNPALPRVEPLDFWPLLAPPIFCKKIILTLHKNYRILSLIHGRSLLLISCGLKGDLFY